VWRFAGQGEAANTYRLLASSGERVDDLTQADLQRVTAALKVWPHTWCAC
jgi:hypothetical protein